MLSQRLFPRGALALLLGVFFVHPGRTQVTVLPSSPSYAPSHTWSVFSEYSPSSSHIILGVARERKFVTVGMAYTRNMYRGQHWDLNYLFEVRPFMLESDPVVTEQMLEADLPPPYGKQDQTMRYVPAVPVLEIEPCCFNDTFPYDGQNYYVDSRTYYSRRWTYAGGMSPLGIKLNLMRNRRLQPIFMANGGFAISSRDVPMFKTSNGNFTFSFGTGFDIFERNGQVVRLQYRIQHFSNADLGGDPGIDSQMLYVGYAWGR